MPKPRPGDPDYGDYCDYKYEEYLDRKMTEAEEAQKEGT